MAAAITAFEKQEQKKFENQARMSAKDKVKFYEQNYTAGSGPKLRFKHSTEGKKKQ